MKRYINVFKTLANSHLTIKQVRVLNKLSEDEVLVSTVVARRNLEENSTTNYQQLYLLSKQQGFKLLSRETQKIDNLFTSNSSPINPLYQAKLSTYPDITNKTKNNTVLEILNNQNGLLHQSLNLTRFHEDVLNNDMVGDPLIWNQNQTKLLYIAKPKAPENKCFFQITDDKDLPDGLKYNKYQQSFGEKMDDVITTNIYLYDLAEQKLFQLPIPDNIFPAYPQFDQEDRIIFGGYKIHPEFKYGIVHCFNRESHVYRVAESQFKQISPPQESKDKEQLTQLSQLTILSNDEVSIKPIVSPNFKQLIYLGTPLNHQHLSYLSMKLVDLETLQIVELVPIQQENLTLQARDDIQKRNNLFNANQTHNSQLLHYDPLNNLIFYTDETINQPGKLFSFFLDANTTHAIDVQASSLFFENQSALQESFLYSNEAEGFLWKLPQQDKPLFSEVKSYIQLQDSERPLVLMIHGGPHGATQSEFTFVRYILLNQGFNILAPNFTGSIGYGQKFIENLSGNIGTLDAEEIIDMLKQVIDKKLCDPKKIFVTGGSYGGYMSNIMGSRYSEYFKATIILNPVSNLAFSVNISDIPEWNLSAGLNSHVNWNLTPGEYRKLLERSPMVDHLKIPTLLLLGAKDRRCPFQQSLALRAQTIFNKTEIETYVYPESDHSLVDSIFTSFDIALKTLLFIDKHIG